MLAYFDDLDMYIDIKYHRVATYYCMTVNTFLL